MLEMVDRRLAAIGTEYLDAFYIHGIGPREYGPQSLEWPKSDTFKKVATQLKSIRQVKMVGFSCHDGRLTDYLNGCRPGRVRRCDHAEIHTLLHKRATTLTWRSMPAIRRGSAWWP